MGYALGRIEEYSPPNTLGFNIFHVREDIGHLASIAVHERFQGQGLAQGLMARIHFNFAFYYHLDKANLYCRVNTSFRPKPCYHFRFELY